MCAFQDVAQQSAIGNNSGYGIWYVSEKKREKYGSDNLQL